MPRTGSQLHRTRNPSHAGTSRSKNLAAQIPSSKINIETVRHRLTKTLLRWCLYDGQCRPFLWLRDGTHPLAVRPVNPGLLPRPGRSDRQRRWVPENLGPGRQIVSQDSPSGVSRIGGQAGTQAPTLRPHHRKTAEAGPEALSTFSLPNRAPVLCLSFPGKGDHRTPSSGLAQPRHTRPASLFASRRSSRRRHSAPLSESASLSSCCCQNRAAIGDFLATLGRSYGWFGSRVRR